MTDGSKFCTLYFGVCVSQTFFLINSLFLRPLCLYFIAGIVRRILRLDVQFEPVEVLVMPFQMS
jgi:hypothetical protein